MQINKLTKNILIALIIFVFIFSFNFHIKPGSVNAEMISLDIRSEDNFIVEADKYAHIFCTSNLDSIVSIYAKLGENVYIIHKNLELFANIEKDISFPVAYPLISNFDLIFNITEKFGTQINEIIKKFIIKRGSPNPYSIKGRIYKCSDTDKTGIEGAKIETESGPVYSKTISEDDGYFSLDNLSFGTYKIKVTHNCASSSVEKIVVLGEKTAFLDMCLSTYGIPDIDLWLNKQSGSNFEIGETITIYMRSSLNLTADMFLYSENNIRKPIILNNKIDSGSITKAYWKVSEEESLGSKSIVLIPKDTNLCGEARYQINITSSVRFSTIKGRITCKGLPLEGAEVYLPFQFSEHVKTDPFGFYVLKNIPPGIHIIRCTSSGFYQIDKRGVEAVRGSVADNVDFELIPEEVEFNIYPPDISVITHAQREKQIDIEVSLKKGFIENVIIEKLEGPDEIILSTSKIEKLLRETRIIKLIVSQKCPSGFYILKYRIGNEESSIEFNFQVVVTGISQGIFDGQVIPSKLSIPQGETANFKLYLQKFSNFLEKVDIELINLPEYSKFIKQESIIPPGEIDFSIETSLSAPMNKYNLFIKATSDDYVTYFPFELEILKMGGELTTIPEYGWNPIFSPGETKIIPIAVLAEKGTAENVRVNIDFGPDWLKFENRSLGTVIEKPVFSYIVLTPPKDIFNGGYDYSISFTYGKKNEGFKKFSGRITLLSTDEDAPTNLRAKYISEDEKVMITWGIPSSGEENIAGYNIYRSVFYPSFEGGIPINSTLIKERSFEDKDYRIGNQYWYVARAVNYDGTLSPKSNTADIAIPSMFKENISITLEKGEGSTYFVGEPLYINYSSNISGNIEVSLESNYLRVVLLQKEIYAGLNYLLSLITPDLPEDVNLIIKTNTINGINLIHSQKVKIKRSIKGDKFIKGKLINSFYDLPLSSAKITIYNGDSRGDAITNEDGSFVISDLKEGPYTLLIIKDKSRVISDQIRTSLKDESINIMVPLDWDKNTIAWLPNNDSSLSYGKQFKLNYKTSKSTSIKIKIRNNLAERIIIPEKTTTDERTYSELYKIPDDIPEGLYYLSLEDLKYPCDWIFALNVTGSTKLISGIVTDKFGNPVEKAKISSSDSEINVETNDFGYFYLDKRVEKIFIEKKGYLKQEIEIGNQSNVKITLDYLESSIFFLDDPITTIKELNSINFKFMTHNGSVKDVLIRLITKNNEVIIENGPIEILPNIIYEFRANEIDTDDLLKIEIAKDDNITEIPIFKGLEKDILHSSYPDIIILNPGKEKQIELDLYSFKTYRNAIKLEYKSNLDKLKVNFDPQSIIPSSTCKLFLRAPDNAEEGFYLLNIKLINDKESSVIPIHFYVKKESKINFINDEWNPILYKDSTDKNRFYFNSKINNIRIENQNNEIKINNFDNFIELEYLPSEEGVFNYEIKVLINNSIEQNIRINSMIITRKEYKPQTITAESNKEGIELSIESTNVSMFYYVNRNIDRKGVAFLNINPLRELKYTDKNVTEGKIYNYSIFSTDGNLEAYFSNSVKVKYRKLFLAINIKDGQLTNKEKIDLKGSVSVGASLTINERYIKVENNGSFTDAVYLKEGLNTIICIIDDRSGNILTEKFKIILDTISPKLKIIEPAIQDNVETVLDIIILVMQTEYDAILTINGIRINHKMGEVNYRLELNYGRNPISVVATDQAGNQTKLNLLIIRYRSISIIELKIGDKRALVSGKEVILDVPPQIISGRTLVPIRFISEAFGAEVIWNAEAKSIKINLNNSSIELKIGDKRALVSGKEVILDVPPQIISGRTLVPIRFISEAFGAEVIWNAEAKSIKINYRN